MRVRHKEDPLSCQSLVQQCWDRFPGPGSRGDLLPSLEERVSFNKNIYLTKSTILSNNITPGRTPVGYTI